MKGAGTATIVLAGALLLGGAARAQAPPAAPKIAYVDLARVMIRSQTGVAAREQLEREKTQMQRELDERREEMDKLREELETKGTLLTAEVRREKEDQLERKRRDATRLADDYRRDLARKEQQLEAKVLQELRDVIERFGRQRGYDMILEARNAGVLYATPDADLTDEIIRAYDQVSTDKGKKK
jgi:outer membrane protein